MKAYNGAPVEAIPIASEPTITNVRPASLQRPGGHSGYLAGMSPSCSSPPIPRAAFVVFGNLFLRSLSAREHFDKPILEFETFEILLYPDTLVLTVCTHVVDIAERTIDSERRNPPVAQIETVRCARAHHRHHDNIGEHLFGQRLYGRHYVRAEGSWLTRVRVTN